MTLLRPPNPTNPHEVRRAFQQLIDDNAALRATIEMLSKPFLGSFLTLAGGGYLLREDGYKIGLKPDTVIEQHEVSNTLNKSIYEVV